MGAVPGNGTGVKIPAAFQTNALTLVAAEVYAGAVPFASRLHASLVLQNCRTRAFCGVTNDFMFNFSETGPRKESLVERFAASFSICAFLALAGSAGAEVRVFVQETNAAAAIRYECTAGEEVRAFALNVSVSQGQIVGISDFFRGPSTVAASGYGIFPASFRDHITVSSGTNANWEAAEYTPIALMTDDPTDTLPGLGSSGVTLELGALWDPTVPGSAPAASGTLCVLQMTDPANVAATPNASRGGVLASSGVVLAPVFTGGFVDPVARITTISLDAAVVTISFRGGELMKAPAVGGPWTGTGNTTGLYSQEVSGVAAGFFRVRHF